jgi:threonine dehydratase
MARGPAMVESLKVGRVVEIVEEPTLADALAGGLNPDNAYTLPMVQQYVDETVLVSEEEIAAAMVFAFNQHRLVVEGGGAVGLAALLHDKIDGLGRQVAVVVSGGNVNPALLMEIVGRSNA